MKQFKKSKAWTRAISIMAATAIIVGGVTFAVLQSQRNTLTGNSIETKTANLQMSVDGTIYSSSHGGFDFRDLMPGGDAVPATGYPVYFKNVGKTPLALKLSVISVPTNLGGADLSKVNILLTPVGGGATQSFTLQSLIDSNTTAGIAISDGNLAVDAIQEYMFQVSMTADAVNSAGASLNNIDLSFTGVAQIN